MRNENVMITPKQTTIDGRDYFFDDFGVIHQKNIINTVDYSHDHYHYCRCGKDRKELDSFLRNQYLRLGLISGVFGGVPESILDFGYGNGFFLSVAVRQIKHCAGFEVNGAEVPGGCHGVSDPFSRHYDVVCLFDVIEHIPDLLFVSRLDCGLLVLSVPWLTVESWNDFASWKHRRPDEHIHHFNRESLQRCMKSLGFDLVFASNIEDVSRPSTNRKPNILTACFRPILRG